MARVHVVGAGLAGLSAAVTLAKAGRSVTVYEASGQAGGRCRSYFDTRLDRTIDNGNHLLLSGNRAAMRYLEEIGAEHRLTGPERAEFPFMDLDSRRRWTLRPGSPWWILRRGHRAPGTGLPDGAAALRLLTAGPDHTVAHRLRAPGASRRVFWDPLVTSALNTPPETASAHLLRRVLRETLLRGDAACRPRFACDGLSHALVDPAVELLRDRGAAIRFHRRLRAVRSSGNRAAELEFGVETVAVPAGAHVILALPPWDLKRILPRVTTPQGTHAIVNAHFKLPASEHSSILGLVGGTAQWLFVRGDVASATVSAADALAEEPAERIAALVWTDVAKALGAAPAPLPPFRIVKEKRATCAQTPANERRRPGTRGPLANLFLAGDWIDTGLPATIESAVRSGNHAALATLKSAA